MSGATAQNRARKADLFFGRQAEIAWLIERLERDDRLLVVHSPSAVGKTALLRHLAHHWQHEVVAGRYVPVYLDVARAADWGGASPLLQIAGEVGRSVRAQTRVRISPPEAPAFAADPAAAWQAYAGLCAEQIEDRRLVLLVDGLDGACDAETDGARRWLRALLEAPLPMVLAVADPAVVGELRPEATVSALPLGPLETEAAEALLKASLGEGVQIDPWATRRVLELTSLFPLYLRRFAEALLECGTLKTILMQPDVDTALEMLLDRSLPEFSVTWRELDENEQFVLASLGALRGTRGAATQYDVRAVCDQYGYPLSWDEILDAMNGLAERGILEKLGSNNYRFSLELFRLWVHRHRPPEYVLRDGAWRSGSQLAAYQISKVKRALGRRPTLLMSLASVLLVAILVALQPIFWGRNQPRDQRSTSTPVAEAGVTSVSLTSTHSSTRSVAPASTLSSPTPQPARVLPGYDLVMMSRSSEDEPYQLLAVNPLSGETLPLTQTGSNERTPRWAPDGRRLAFVSDRDGEREVYLMDVAQPDAAPLNLSQHPGPDWQPSWSPDGQRVAFASYRDGNWEIYVVDADGNNLERLTEHAENDFSPSWAPDGRRLVFASRRYADADLFVLDTETRAITQLTTGQWNEFEPAWSPDGEWIAYVTHIEDQGDIFVMRADGSEAVNLTNSPYANDFQPAWTPDSQRLIYVSYTAAKGDHDLWSMARDGSDARVLVDDPRDDLAPNWRPAGTAGAGTTGP